MKQSGALQLNAAEAARETNAARLGTDFVSCADGGREDTSSWPPGLQANQALPGGPAENASILLKLRSNFVGPMA